VSNSLDGYHGPANPLEADDAWYEHLALKYPNLADALLGNAKNGAKGPVRPPLSVMISAKEGRLRFCLSSPDSSRSYFGPIDDPCEPLEAAERALAACQGEWVTKNPGRR